MVSQDSWPCRAAELDQFRADISAEDKEQLVVPATRMTHDARTFRSSVRPCVRTTADYHDHLATIGERSYSLVLGTRSPASSLSRRDRSRNPVEFERSNYAPLIKTFFNESQVNR